MDEDIRVPVQARSKSSAISIGDLARLSGVRPSAIRYYEECGLLPAPERRSGRRRYDPNAATRLKAIVTARRLGFSIAEMRELTLADIQDWRKAARAKALSLKALIAKLNADAAHLDELSSCACASQSACCL